MAASHFFLPYPLLRPRSMLSSHVPHPKGALTQIGLAKSVDDEADVVQQLLFEGAAAVEDVGWL